MHFCFKILSTISLVVLFTSTARSEEYDDFAAPVDSEEPEEPSMSDPEYTMERNTTSGTGTTLDAIEALLGIGATNFYSSGISTTSDNYKIISTTCTLATDADYSFEFKISGGQGSFQKSQNKFNTANATMRWVQPLFMKPNEESPLYGGADVDLRYLSSSTFSPDQTYQGHNILGIGLFVGYEWEWNKFIVDIEKSVSQTYGKIKTSGKNQNFKDGISSNLKSTLYFYNIGLGFIRKQMWQKQGDDATTIQSDFITLGYRYTFN